MSGARLITFAMALCALGCGRVGFAPLGVRDGDVDAPDPTLDAGDATMGRDSGDGAIDVTLDAPSDAGADGPIDASPDGDAEPPPLPTGDVACGFAYVSPLPHPATLGAVWGAASNDVWFAGDELQHWDGAAFELIDGPFVMYTGVSGTASDDVWLSSQEGLARWNGSSFERVTEVGGAWNDVHARARDDVWIVGAGGEARHFDGMTWTEPPGSPTTDALFAVSSDGPGTAWAGGDNGTVVRLSLTGATLEPTIVGESADVVSIFAVPGGGDVWVGRQFTDDLLRRLPSGMWTIVDAGEVPSGGEASSGFASRNVSGTGASDVWAVGGGGTVRWTGASFEPHVDAPLREARAVYARGPDEAWLTGFDSMRAHWNGDRWSNLGSLTTASLDDIEGRAANDVWVVGHDPHIVLHFDGARWTQLPGLPTLGPATYGVLPFDGETWVSSRVGAHRWNGAAWEQMGALSVYELWGATPSDVWAVHGFTIAMASVVRIEDGVEHIEPLPRAAQLYGIRGIAADDVWAVGAEGSVFRWDGDSWNELTSGTTSTLFRVVPVTRDDVWFSASDDTVLHYDGMGFMPRPIPAGTSLRALTVADGIAWIVVGGSPAGGVYRWIDGAWAPYAVGCDLSAGEIWIAPGATDGWIIGSNSGILRLVR